MKAEQVLRFRLGRLGLAHPGVVLLDGRIAGTWRARARGRRSAFAIEELRRIPKRRLEEEAQRIAAVRGAEDFELDCSR